MIKSLDTTFEHDGEEYKLSLWRYACTIYKREYSVWAGDLFAANLGIKPGTWVVCNADEKITKVGIKSLVTRAAEDRSYLRKLYTRSYALENLLSSAGLNEWQILKVKNTIFSTGK